MSVPSTFFGNIYFSECWNSSVYGYTSDMTTNTCHKCNSTGYRLEVAHCDGGRCWHCNKVDTTYTLTGSAAHAEAEAALFAQDAQRRIERQARAAARRSTGTQS